MLNNTTRIKKIKDEKIHNKIKERKSTEKHAQHVLTYIFKKMKKNRDNVNVPIYNHLYTISTRVKHTHNFRTNRLYYHEKAQPNVKCLISFE